MIISIVARSDIIDILHPANLTPEMILELRIYKFTIVTIIRCQVSFINNETPVSCEHFNGRFSPSFQV